MIVVSWFTGSPSDASPALSLTLRCIIFTLRYFSKVENAIIFMIHIGREKLHRIRRTNGSCHGCHNHNPSVPRLCNWRKCVGIGAICSWPLAWAHQRSHFHSEPTFQNYSNSTTRGSICCLDARYVRFKEQVKIRKEFWGFSRVLESFKNDAEGFKFLRGQII